MQLDKPTIIFVYTVLKSLSKRLRHYDIFLCSFCNVCPIFKLSSQIYSLDYEDYFQLLATAQKRFLHFENEDEKITVLRRQYLCALKYNSENPQAPLNPNMYLVLRLRHFKCP